jgi:hypothetical protein
VDCARRADRLAIHPGMSARALGASIPKPNLSRVWLGSPSEGWLALEHQSAQSLDGNATDIGGFLDEAHPARRFRHQHHRSESELKRCRCRLALPGRPKYDLTFDPNYKLLTKTLIEKSPKGPLMFSGPQSPPA